MPVADGGGGAKPPRKPPPIVVFNPATGGSVAVDPVRPSGGSTAAPVKTPPKPLGAPKGGTKGGSQASATASSSASSAASAAQKKYDAQRAADKKAASDRYMVDAANMQGQVDALRNALGPKGRYKDALEKRLANIDLITGQQISMLDQVAAERQKSLDADMDNNRKAAGDQTVANDANRMRERTMAVAEIAAQGAGESDGLRAQLMSLRSWDANQGEVNRAFHDSQRSIQAATLDLQADTATAKANALSEANADRGQLWNEYFAQSAESFTQLGNTLGQQAEYYGLAKEQGANLGAGKGKGGRGGKGGKSGAKGPRGQWSSQESGGRDGGGSQWGSQDLGGKGGRLGQMTERPSAGGFDETRGGNTASSGLTSWADGGRNGGKGGGGKGGGKGGGGKGRGRPRGGNLQEQAAAASDKAFMQASNWMGRAWRDPGLGELGTFTPESRPTEQLSTSLLQSARTLGASKAPEGASLRKW